jgi:hypothetical protein
MDFSQSQERGETGKRMDRALKDNGIAQHPNRPEIVLQIYAFRGPIQIIGELKVDA